MVHDVLGLVHAAGDQAAPPHAPDESKPSAHKARARADLVRDACDAHIAAKLALESLRCAQPRVKPAVDDTGCTGCTGATPAAGRATATAGAATTAAGCATATAGCATAGCATATAGFATALADGGTATLIVIPPRYPAGTLAMMVSPLGVGT
eukprot:CAMPEP_0185288726 /NCGR_PEP_ID=MMETSP1363-20130426/3549_1 /TAXON_ID=38817 /ORGANISM="Gephyrocapsa oceanica, Strain RCC1303" /LENGTH=152 /DNA_ID=CAMNT_0027884605 /DNA_START=267 /DNA_END=726 /DNA_ORIENTATION=+